ncbi:MAG: PfkB family carbohydrate kinase [bacterium]|nr:PfkB family carbohydrate kinase [bacterium]
MSLLIVGSIALDTVRTPFGVVEDALGGAAVYASCAASFFTDVSVAGVAGRDFPSRHTDFLSSRGIDISGLEITEGQTFRWSGRYDFDLNQAHTLDTQLNVFADFRPDLGPAQRRASHVFLANMDPDIQLHILDQLEQPELVACDTMNFWIDGKPEALKRVISRSDILFINDAEARQLCNTSSLIKAARELHDTGLRAVVIKKGEHGSLMLCDEGFFAAPSYPLEEVRDPTGAGDSFAGGFMGYLVSEGDCGVDSLRCAVICGSVVASYNVEDFSLERMKQLDRNDIAARFNEFRHLSTFESPGALLSVSLE